MAAPETLVAGAMDALESAVAILDEHGVIAYTNMAWQQFAIDGGFPGDPAMVGVDYLEACEASRDNDEYVKQAWDGINALLSGETNRFQMEYPCPTAGDPELWFLLWATTFTHDGARYVLIEHLNIADRNKIEQATLERNKRLSTVSSVLSHDLRNPMSVALGYAELLEDNPDDAALEHIVASLNRMDLIIDDAVTLSRQQLDETEAVSLCDVVETTWGLIETSDATLRCHEDLTFEADRSILESVFQNLFSNAIEHGGADVTIGVGPLAEGRGFFVENNGPPIPPAQYDFIFEPGYSTNAVESNSGLGLAIVENAVSIHGWEIDVTLAESGGPRFEIQFPDSPF